MDFHPPGFRTRLAAVLTFTFVVFLICGGARAADAEAYCDREASIDGASAVTDASLSLTSARIEAQISSPDPAAADWRTVLSVPQTPGAKPTVSSLAAYCAAAGAFVESVSPEEWALARRFQLTAFVYARQAKAPNLVALSAYRLSAILPDEMTDVNGRGPFDQTRGPASPGGIDACANAVSDKGAALANAIVLLSCAGQSAALAKDWPLASLSNLRLARRLMSESNAALIGVEDAAIVGVEDKGAGGKPRARPRPPTLRCGILKDPAARRYCAERLRVDAIVSIREGLRAAEQVPDGRERARYLGQLVEAALDAGAVSDNTLSAFITDMRQSAGADPAIEAFASALSARVALAGASSETARSLIRNAVLLEGERTQPYRLADWYMLLAGADAADPAQRARDVRDAYVALESVRPLLPPRDLDTDESTFAVHMRPVFEAAAEVALTRQGDDPAIILETQKIYESYREAEIESVFGDNCLPMPAPLNPGELKAGEVILYPILLPDRVELFYAVAGDPAGYHRLAPNLGFNRASVTALVATFRASLISAATTHQDEAWQSASHKLYGLLIAPIEDKLSEKGNLVIVPDGPLRTLPFAALQKEGAKAFLIQQTRISLAPALSYSQPGVSGGGRRATVVAAAVHAPQDLPVGHFDELKATDAEARSAAAIDVRRGHRAPLELLTREALIKAMKHGHVDVLHLATHASFNGRSELSYIVAEGGVIPLAELARIIGQNRVRGDALDLLVLSACETAVGDDEASMGLASAAVQAGARSALASVWSVNDVSTGRLMERFYEGYHAGLGKAGALGDAQIALLTAYRTGAGPDFSEPYFWAGFVLIGGWR